MITPKSGQDLKILKVPFLMQSSFLLLLSVSFCESLSGMSVRECFCSVSKVVLFVGLQKIKY